MWVQPDLKIPEMLAWARTPGTDQPEAVVVAEPSARLIQPSSRAGRGSMGGPNILKRSGLGYREVPQLCGLQCCCATYATCCTLNLTPARTGCSHPTLGCPHPAIGNTRSISHAIPVFCRPLVTYPRTTAASLTSISSCRSASSSAGGKSFVCKHTPGCEPTSSGHIWSSSFCLLHCFGF
jgi:hypothetical protein